MSGRSIKQHFNKGDTKYVPVYPEKYRGRPPIICRSSWEEAFCRWADFSSAIVGWSSEEIRVKYQDPIEPIKFGKPKFRTYYPDFVIETKNGDVFLIEVKPYKQTKAPTKSTGKSGKTMLTEEKAWRTNQAKWRAAKAFCARKGWVFKIITEKELFGKK